MSNIFKIIQAVILVLLLVILPYCLIDNVTFGIACKTSSAFSSDKYCIDFTNRTDMHNWVVRSHEEDRINTGKRLAKLEKARIAKEAYLKCYDEGYFVNESLLISDYFNCNQIEYLNDHLMDNFEKKNAGYVRGHSSSLFGSGYIEGKTYQYINDRVLATGQLIENINYQVDCNDKHQDEKINYYTEEEFVMFYVKECIR